MSPAQVRRALEKNAAERTRLEEALKANIKERLLLDQIARLHSESILHNSHKAASLKRMEAQTKPGPARGQRLKSKHPFPRKAREVDGSVAATARKLGVTDSAARSWYVTTEAARKIPDAIAKKLEAAPYLIPLSAWKNGIQTDAD